MNFLRTSVEMMMDDGNIEYMIIEGFQKGIGLMDIAVQFQRDMLEFNFQIERDFGCRFLAQINTTFPKDEEVLSATKRFMYTALESYLKGLKLRHAMYESGRLSAPDPSKKMSKVTILEFFEACCALSKYIFKFM
jgi:hypothetical protein